MKILKMVHSLSYAVIVIFSTITITLEDNVLDVFKVFYSKKLQEDLFHQVADSVYDNELSMLITKKEWTQILSKDKKKMQKIRSLASNTCTNLLKDLDCRYLRDMGHCQSKAFQMEGLCPKECGFCGTSSPPCRFTRYGCCRDKVNRAMGPNFEGCPGTCIDKRGQRFCRVVKRLSYCLNEYGQFIDTCTFSCGFCRPCKDLMPVKCFHASTFGNCKRLKTVMMNDCRKTCNYCGSNDICFKFKGCPTGSGCFVHDDGKPFCKCKRQCHPGDYHTGKVCGRNNREYKSLCELKQTICARNYHLTIRNYGHCKHAGNDGRAMFPARCKKLKEWPICKIADPTIFCKDAKRAKLCPVTCGRCDVKHNLPSCSYSKYGCCLDGTSICNGVGYEGCPDKKRRCKDISLVLCRRFVALCGHKNHVQFLKQHCSKTCQWC